MLSAMKRATLSATTIRSRSPGALILVSEARATRLMNVRAKRTDFFVYINLFIHCYRERKLITIIILYINNKVVFRVMETKGKRGIILSGVPFV